MLQLIDLHAYYGDSHILQGISLEVKKGQIVALLGRNGVGKTTTIKSIIGFVPPRQGKVIFKGIDVTGLQPFQIAGMGIGLVPQGRRIFPSLSVRENLLIASRHTQGDERWNLSKIYSLFPILKERAALRGTQLSGGEQQMLAIGRALMSNPELLLMDEPSEGLSPMLVQEIGLVTQQLKQEGLSILLVEQNLPLALKVADYVYLMSKGGIVGEYLPQDLMTAREVQAHYLGV